LKDRIHLFVFIVVLATAVYLIIQNIGVFGNILLVLIGFGAVILVHEFGHFLVAKLSDIKVEAFSIGFPPTLVGILRTESGYRIRILPDILKKEGEESEGCKISFTVGKSAKGGETEYRIGLIPLGGFVKMLGQEDVGTVKSPDDPRSFANKSVGIRAGVISAGVVFNAISAIMFFMIVFLVGIDRVPAVVGGVAPGSPAAAAGLKGGDEIIEIDGKSRYLEYYNIAIAAALSGRDEEVELKVRGADGSIKECVLVARQVEGEEVKQFGISSPQSLTITEVRKPDVLGLEAKTGLRPGDKIKSVNGVDVRSSWQLAEVISGAVSPDVTVLAERGEELVESRFKLDLLFSEGQVKSEGDLNHIYSMVPRLRIKGVLEGPVPISEKIFSLFDRLLIKIGLRKKVIDDTVSLKEGDIILAVGDIENPTYKDLRDVTEDHKGKELGIMVLRKDADGFEKPVSIAVVPKRSSVDGRVLIGIATVLDAEHAVVAKTISVEGGPAALEIPRGAVITAVDGTSVSSFYDVIREIRRYEGERIGIDWRLDEEVGGDTVIDVENVEDFIKVRARLAEYVPFKPLERLYKARGPIEAIAMGWDKTIMFIAQSYVTLQRVFSGLVSPKSFMGPVGIVTFTYRIVAEQPFVVYVYWLGLISAMVAVFNFLPVPPFDGGLVVLLGVEKIKGSPLSEKTQGIIAYAGWVLVGTFILYVTFNDIVRSFFS